MFSEDLVSADPGSGCSAALRLISQAPWPLWRIQQQLRRDLFLLAVHDVMCVSTFMWCILLSFSTFCASFFFCYHPSAAGVQKTNASCLMSKSRPAECPWNTHVLLPYMQMLLPVWLSLRLRAISITGSWARSSFKELRTSPITLCPTEGIIHVLAAQMRLLHKHPPVCPAANAPKREAGSAISSNVMGKQCRCIRSTSRLASATLYFQLESLFKPSACLRRVERERQGEGNVGYPRGRRLLPQERPVLNKSFNFHAQLPYLPLIQCGSE